MTHGENTTFGLANISGNQTVVNNSYSPDLGIADLFNRTGTALGSDIAGGTQMSGILMLLVFGAALFYGDVDTDVAAVVMFPTAIFLGSEGFLPFGTSITYSAIIGVAAIFAYGLVDYAFT